MKKYFTNPRLPWTLVLLAYILVLGSFLIPGALGMFTCVAGMILAFSALAARSMGKKQR